MNRVKSGPGPLRKIYDKISALQYDVDHLKSELRIVKRKLNNYEQKNNGPVSFKHAIVDRIKEQHFAITFTPVSDPSDESVNIVQLSSSSRIRNRHKRARDRVPVPLPDPGNIYVNDQIFADDNDSDNDNGQIDETESGPFIETDQKQDVTTILDDINQSPPVTPDEYRFGPKNEKKIIRKKLDPIWSKYKISFNWKGERLATCRSCLNKVSAKAKRLKHHFDTCRAKSISHSPKPRSRGTLKRKPKIDRESDDSSENQENEPNSTDTTGHTSVEPNSSITSTISKRKRINESSEDDNDNNIDKPDPTQFRMSLKD